MRVLLPLVAVAVGENRAVGEGFVAVDRPGEIDGAFIGFVGADAHGDLLLAGEERLLGDVVDLAADGGAADEHGHGALGDLDAIHILGVETVELAEAVAEGAVVGLAAETGEIALAIAAPGTGGEVAVGGVVVERDGADIRKRAEKAAFAGIAEKLAGDHGDREGRVHQGLGDTGGGDGILHAVAGVLGAAHFEGGEHEGFARRSGWRGGNLSVGSARREERGRDEEVTGDGLHRTGDEHRVGVVVHSKLVWPGKGTGGAMSFRVWPANVVLVKSFTRERVTCAHWIGLVSISDNRFVDPKRLREMVWKQSFTREPCVRRAGAVGSRR